MNYKVLYRKYRPDNFETIVGQDYIIKTLKNSIINNNISHAYIFSGPRGTGKTSTAKVFAKAINCLNPQNGSPCGKCEFCKNYNENPDIIEMDAASNNGVDEIREIIDNVKLTPTNGKYKVYIIDEVHMLTTSAFNALLLTLEEPPAHIIFILATTNVENVPITILSRCQRFDFQKISIENIKNSLANICLNEGIDADEEALEEIAYISEGGMRDALSLLDQLSKNKEKITLKLIEKQIRTLSKATINSLITTIENNELDDFLNQIEDYKKRGIDYKSFLKKMIDSLSIRAKSLKQTGKFKRLNFENYKNLIIELSECFVKININVDPYNIIEMIILNYFNINDSDDLSRNNEQKTQIETSPLISGEVNTKLNDKIINVRINNCFVDAKKEDLELTKNYIEKISFGSNTTGKIKSILVDSLVAAASYKYIILTCQNDHLALTANEYSSDIEKLIKENYNNDYKLVFISEKKWQEVKKEYISNIKNGKKYQYIEEEIPEDSTVVNDVFDVSKVEII